MLTKRQRDVLVFIEAYQRREGGVSPSCAEIAKGVGTTSKGRASEVLSRLEERGFIRRLKHRNRAIEILKPAPSIPPNPPIRTPAPSRIPIYRAGDSKLMGFIT